MINVSISVMRLTRPAIWHELVTPSLLMVIQSAKMKIFRRFCPNSRNFCQKSAHNIFFLGLTDYYLSEYEKQGFGLVKSGEEARFKLSDYDIAGKKGAKMRMNINHATKPESPSMNIKFWKSVILLWTENSTELPMNG